MLTRGIGALLTKGDKQIMNKIQKLKCSINRKCASKDYEQVNKCIDEIIFDKPKGADIEEIKSLICHLEGNGNQTNAYTVMSMCYSFFIGVISTINFVSSSESTFFSFILLFVIVALVLVAMMIKHKDYKEAFILKALNFKLEELNNKPELFTEHLLESEC